MSLCWQVGPYPVYATRGGPLVFLLTSRPHSQLLRLWFQHHLAGARRGLLPPSPAPHSTHTLGPRGLCGVGPSLLSPTHWPQTPVPLIFSRGCDQQPAPNARTRFGLSPGRAWSPRGRLGRQVPATLALCPASGTPAGGSLQEARGFLTQRTGWQIHGGEHLQISLN